MPTKLPYSPGQTVSMKTDSPISSEKPDEDRIQDASSSGDEIHAADQLPPEFAHLDEKKILRKVCPFAMFNENNR